MRPRHPAQLAVAALLASGLTLPLAQARDIAPTPGQGRWVIVSGYLVTTAGPEPAYAVAPDEGPLVPVFGELSSAAGDRVTVRVRVPSALDALDGPWRTRESLGTWGRPLAAEVTSQAEVAPSTVPVEHTVYVARPTNVGGSSMSDAEVLAELGAVADYWVDEADGQITGFDLPDSSADAVQFATYDTEATADAVCRFGDDSFSFLAMAEEAAAQFPNVSFGGPDVTDMLVVVTPDLVTCPNPSPSGQAILGSGFTGGGVAMARGGPSIVRGGLAHEIGHNFGLEHSNIGETEYLNLYNVMGGGVADVNQLTALSAAYRVGAGIDAPGEILTVAIEDPTEPVTVTETLAPRTSETGQRGLAVTPPDTRQTFYVDYRSGLDQDAGSVYAQGLSALGYVFRPGVVVEEIWKDVGHGVSLLPDRNTFGRTATIEGETWTSPTGTMSLTVDSTSVSGAQVTATYTPPPPFSGTGQAELVGIPRVGTVLHAVVTGLVPTPAETDWEWLRDGSPIPSADEMSYTPSADDLGHVLSFRMTAYAPGRLPTPVTSGVVTVEPGVLTFSSMPSLSSASPVIGHPLSVSYDYLGAEADESLQWYADGSPVAGATTRTFVPTSVQAGRRLTASVSLALPGWTTVTAYTPPSAPVEAPSVAPSPPPSTGEPTPATLTGPKPTIKGKAVVGRRLTAKTGGWPAGTRFTYRWLANGKVVRKATSATLTVKPALEGKKLSVRVTAAKPGYTSVTLVSARTKRVSGRARAGGLPALEPGIQVPGRGGRELLGSGSPLP